MPGLPLIVFDVNETLLDLETMEPTFERIFGDKKDMRLWFTNLVMYSLVLTLAGRYAPFTDIGAAVLKMMADTQGIEIGDEDKRELKEKFSTMPPTLRSRLRFASCVPPVSACSPSQTIWSRFRAVSLNRVALPTFLNDALASTALRHTSHRVRPMPMSKRNSASPLRSCV